MAAKAAIGTLLKVGDGASPEVFTTVAGMSSITGPTFDSNEIDVTSHDTVGGYREKIPGLKDAGSVSGTLYFDANLSQHQNLLADYNNGTRRNYRLELAGTSPLKYFAFNAAIKAFSYQADVDGAQQVNAEFLINGAATLV